ncbi:MAG: alcohol dehydrogenase catalytic domain-containing protein [Propionibacteriaceae bacterium]
MKAAVLRELGEPLRLENVELDEPGPGEVCVRIEAAGVCHSDLHYMTGDLKAKLPLVVGHEGAGIVEAVGPRTSDRVSVGDRVALLWRPRCGKCEACVAGNPVLCRFGRVFATTNGLMDGSTRLHSGEERIHHLMGVSCFAERVVVSEASVLGVPDSVPPDIAAISACAVITGVSAVLNVVQRAAGQPLAIFGTGGVGLAAVMGAACGRHTAAGVSRIRLGAHIQPPSTIHCCAVHERESSAASQSRSRANVVGIRLVREALVANDRLLGLRGHPLSELLLRHNPTWDDAVHPNVAVSSFLSAFRCE